MDGEERWGFGRRRRRMTVGPGARGTARLALLPGRGRGGARWSTVSPAERGIGGSRRVASASKRTTGEYR